MQSLESCSLNIYCRLSVSFSIKAISNWTIRLREKYFLICMNLTCNNITRNMNHIKKASPWKRWRSLFLSGNMVNRFTESASVSGTPLGLICSVFWIICKNSQRYEILSQKKWDWLFSRFLKATDRPVLNGS